MLCNDVRISAVDLGLDKRPGKRSRGKVMVTYFEEERYAHHLDRLVLHL